MKALSKEKRKILPIKSHVCHKHRKYAVGDQEVTLNALFTHVEA
jgi:hypothetical protein